MNVDVKLRNFGRLYAPFAALAFATMTTFFLWLVTLKGFSTGLKFVALLRVKTYGITIVDRLDFWRVQKLG